MSEHESTIPQENFLILKIQILFRGGGGGVSEHHSKTKFLNSKSQINFRGGGGWVCLNITQHQTLRRKCSISKSQTNRL